MSKENSVDPASHSQTIETSPPTQVEPTLTVRDPPEPEPKVEEAKEPTAFDLLSDIDFSVEQMPLTPEIKVPPVSEKAIVKSSAIRREEVVKPQPKEEVIERPPKRDIFSDPSLINQFTQEVKNLQKLTDYLTNTSPSVLEANLKSSQDLIDKEDKNRSIRIAMRHSRNGESDVDPYDDTKLALKSDPDAYVNASYYKQLTSWCMPLVIAECPDESEIEIFWKAMFEYDVSCIVCLQTEIEMQSASQRAYWPAGAGGGAVGGAGAGAALAAGGVRVALAGLRRAAHWAERELRLSAGAATRTLTHYQLTAFPDKVTCSPLVMLCDAVWRQSGAGAGAGGGGGAGRAVCVQSGEGAGRSALVALLLAAMCQLRAGHIQLCELAQRGAARVAAPAHAQPRLARSLLYYAQGVLCSGTTMFNGEAVSAPSGAAALPPAPGPAPGAGPGPAPAPAPPSGGARGKFNRESFEEMRQAPGLKSGDMKDPLNFLDPLWSLKKK
ncbi:tyrosine-protein phosphatase non-receptor type 23-like [Zerene cesonia]|uniref:tyrosine-protein phosphatase non-receptor type 23-like n=1 Tax=Zerene cesonia TaxID=33412 RepID=UPI0018E5583A|nr:tyrosine-protein phosphatase non-receptor type 23-like [Zerene cesonia]